ncbi:MAG TPA: sigma 54-interacting transcriptional regulator, partial [Symbiobacteriaceae bacterium]|nr:sigma 54-interacting transcriptional regulator [Symbiobacteriaceae bacterium]
MDNRVRTLIDREDRRRPWTDDDLATRLDMRRDQVTIARQQLGIPDSRERRRQAVIEAIRQLPDTTVSDRELTRLLQEQGFEVSRQVVSQCRLEAARLQPPTAPQTPAAPARPSRHRAAPALAPAAPMRAPALAPAPGGQAFDRLVGADGSLKPIVEQVRAAILYPPHGLHTLILGPTGVGKSELAKRMFEFAREAGRMGPDSRFVAFNCADYAENPQLLVSQLFGVAKGAYTGANAEKTGLVEQAHGGMLFLDEVHRLPPDGQEILYYLIDHGSFRRLGETEAARKVQVMIVAATTEDVDSTLLLPFRRRIPMVVRLPGLAERPLSERLVYLENTLAEEATRIGMPIRATADAVKALLLYDCPGNLGGLRSDMQVSCARAFVASVTNRTEGLTLGLGDLPPHVTRGMLRTEGRRRELGDLVPGDLNVMPGVRPTRHLVKDAYMMPRDIYDYVEERHAELTARGVNGYDLERLLGSELESRLQAFVRQVQTAPLATAQKELTGLVGPHVVTAATRMVEIAAMEMGNFDDRLLYCLATHLSAALERIREGRHLHTAPIPALPAHDRELTVAHQMVAAAEESLGLELPPEEVTYVALYMHSCSDSGEKEPRVGVVLLSHGRVASAMAEVANRLLGVSHARAVEMSLDEQPESALERARQAAVEANEGRGVLLLADMGSLVTFGPLITESTGVSTRTVERVDTTVVLDAVRRAMLPGASLDEVAAALPGLKPQAPTTEPGRPRAVLAVCITGQGAALRIRDLVQEAVPNLPVLTDGLVAPDALRQLTEQYDLVATVGTVDPGLPGIPFIPFQEMLHGAGSARLRLLAGHEAG